MRLAITAIMVKVHYYSKVKSTRYLFKELVDAEGVALVSQSRAIPRAIDQVIKGDDVKDELVHKASVEFLVGSKAVCVI
jgi:hypothetical protein